MTGRKAQRKVAVPGGRDPKIFEVVEITPVGDDFDWKKWVRPDDLYEILEQ